MNMGEVVIRTNFWLIFILISLYVFVGSGLFTLLIVFNKLFLIIIIPFMASYFWLGWKLAEIYDIK
ncbi:hypothetical protein LCGC14_0509710 [marine sediment metagenome]|uniref:Uncharacterized protein n=1 Tax=marine sediment metagenome TaxID=412755 RepID=A0A0F9S1S9_9ZZZZ|nr:hypothetical protein [bacterium]